jgi:NhaP-type Na+/H+ or K+/H+ antiporter
MKTREVYLASARVYFASVVARVCAAGLTIGVIGSIVTWDERSTLFDLANSPHGISKPELGYFVGPALILLALPLVRHREPHVVYTSRYRLRLGIAALLWAAGLTVLLVHLAGLDSEYTLQAGAYVATTLLVVGLLATLAMWPAGLATGLFDRRGEVVPDPAP